MTHSFVSHSVHSMNDDLRCAYLKAMGLPLWEPKLVKESLITANHERSVGATALIENEVVAVEEIEEANRKKTPTQTQTIKDASVGSKESSIGSVSFSGEKNESIHLMELPDLASSNGSVQPRTTLVGTANEAKIKYLKMVNWRYQNEDQENAARLLIICRHEVDQPANSFAKPNSPSQFMLDYIKAIITLSERFSKTMDIQMAHLSEAGLGDDAIAMDKVLNDYHPDLVLLLGDETVAQCHGKQNNVAKLRGRLIDFYPTTKSMVSYHPYSLIQNPKLKSLAFEDIVDIFSYLPPLN